RLAGGVAVAHPQTAGLEGRAVGGRRELAVGALGGDPRLAVVLAGRRGTEVAAGDVDHAERQPHGLQHLLLEAQQTLVLRGRLLRRAPGEHLDLVELVHADDAAGVLTVRARLAAEAGGPAAVTFGPLRQVQDLALVIAGERDLRRAHEVEVVVRQV